MNCFERPRHDTVYRRLRPESCRQHPVAEVAVFETGERGCHDLYGLGTVSAVDTWAVTVDFGSQSVRIKPPYAKLQHL